MLRAMICSTIAILLTSLSSYAEGQGRVVVIYDGVPTEVTARPESSKDLWISIQDLTRATRFVVKPQGICRDELCFPIPKGRNSEFISKKGTITWFNLSSFARLVKQPVAPDEKD